MKLIDNYKSEMFMNVYKTQEDFNEDFNEIDFIGLELPEELMNKFSKVLYESLMGKYATSHINGVFTIQWKLKFKTKLYSLLNPILQTYNTKLKYNISNMADFSAFKRENGISGINIHNSALNDGGEPNNDVFEPLKYINTQDITRSEIDNIKLLDFYNNLVYNFNSDIESIIESFSNLFIKVLYETGKPYYVKY